MTYTLLEQGKHDAISEEVAAYIRVSTSTQDTTNQLDQITAWAGQNHYVISEAFTDHALSGAKKRDRRPALDRMMRRRFLEQVAMRSRHLYQ